MKIEMKTAGILGAAVVLGVFLMIEIIREMHTFRVVHYCIESPKLMGMKRARRAVFLTDLHNYCYGENNARLYQAIVDAKPDVIFIGGDICVYPNFAEVVKDTLEVEDVKIACVSAGFPSSQTFIEVKIAETAMAIMEGADEIDIVISVGKFLSGDYETMCDEIQARESLATTNVSN